MTTKSYDDDITSLDEVIDNHLTQMVGIDAHSAEYIQLAKDLSLLYKIKNEEKLFEFKESDQNLKVEEHLFRKEEINLKRERDEVDIQLKQQEFALKERELYLKEKEIDRKGKVSGDTMMLVAGNLTGLLLILNYERLNVITTKAMSLLIKAR